MKENRSKANRIGAAALLVALALTVSTAWALHMTVFPDEMQTKNPEPVERRISLKLPLEQPTFHWEFRSREALLAGKLVLRITRGEKTEEIVIFADGKFSEDWDAPKLGDIPREGGEVYFCFQSSTNYLTAPGDKLEIELTVTTDLDGIGSLQTGVLPAGKYVSKGNYSGLVDVLDTSKAEALFRGQSQTGMLTDQQRASLQKVHETADYKAWLENWETQWPLRITGEKGWLPEDKAEESRKLKEKLDRLEQEARRERQK